MPSGGQAVSCSGLAAWKNLGEERERGRFQIHAPPPCRAETVLYTQLLNSSECICIIPNLFWCTHNPCGASSDCSKYLWNQAILGFFHSDWSASPWISTGAGLTVLFGSSKLHGMGIQSWTDLVKLFIKAPKHPNGILKYHERPHCIAFMVERPVKLKNVYLQFSHQ